LKAAGISNMAFVCWNRFLDITDAIDEGESSLLENADFADTDVPFDVELPSENMPVNFFFIFINNI
jgi:intraflagellar transport protein 172